MALLGIFWTEIAHLPDINSLMQKRNLIYLLEETINISGDIWSQRAEESRNEIIAYANKFGIFLFKFDFLKFIFDCVAQIKDKA